MAALQRAAPPLPAAPDTDVAASPPRKRSVAGASSPTGYARQTFVPKTEAQWVPDSRRDRCQGACRKSFGFIRRKHHCRACGDIFCEDCSGYRLLVRSASRDLVSVRVCSLCFNEYSANEGDALNQSPPVVHTQLQSDQLHSPPPLLSSNSTILTNAAAVAAALSTAAPTLAQSSSLASTLSVRPLLLPALVLSLLLVVLCIVGHAPLTALPLVPLLLAGGYMVGPAVMAPAPSRRNRRGSYSIVVPQL